MIHQRSDRLYKNTLWLHCSRTSWNQEHRSSRKTSQITQKATDPYKLDNLSQEEISNL